MCKICGTRLPPYQVYDGDVRDGVWGHFVRGVVLGCPNCEAQWLSNASNVDYAHNYRMFVGEDPAKFHELHDHEQIDRLSFLYERGIGVRGARMLDVGCAAGSFLDHVQGLALDTVGIDPCQAYQDQARAIYPRIDLLPSHETLKFDLIVSFLTIEHIYDPVEFMQDMRRYLRPGGKVVVSTPNAEESTLAAPKYQRYFYRVQHPWYFGRRSLAECAQRAGFKHVYVEARGGRPYTNTIGWFDKDDPGLPMFKVDDRVPLWPVFRLQKGDGMYLYMVAE